MSEQAKHTPGPWRVAPPYLYGTGEGIHVDAGARSYIAHVGERGDAQSEADAHLIAAAPDMLAALESLTPILEAAESNASGNPEWPWVSKRINAARAAIAKARGAA